MDQQSRSPPRALLCVEGEGPREASQMVPEVQRHRAKPDDAQMTPQHEAMGFVLESARDRIIQLERELLQLRQ